MSMSTISQFKVDGVAMFAPDADMDFSFEDLDAPDSGRDESGVMHRIVVRYKVGTWSFEYNGITDTELTQMEAMFANKAQFTFTHPVVGSSNTTADTTAYRSKFGVKWHNSTLGLWRNYKFNIIEC